MTGYPEVYVAAPLFSEAERAFNRRVKQLLQPHFLVFLPQEDGALLTQLLAGGVSHQVAQARIFETDIAAVRRAQILLIVLDGRSVDEGAAFELGVAYALGKRCIGLQTDSRRTIEGNNNPMIDQPLEHVFSSLEELSRWAGLTSSNYEPRIAASKCL